MSWFNVPKIKAKNLAIFVLFILCLVLFFQYKTQVFSFLESELKENWIMGGFILFFLYNFLSLLGIPVSPLTLLCGAILGFEKTMIIMVPSLLCATVLLIVAGRSIFSKKINKIRSKRKSIETLFRVLEKDSFKWIFYIRISAMTPFAITSYVFSMLELNLFKLMIPSLLGTLPHLALQSYVGATGGEWLKAEGVSAFKLCFLVFGFGLLTFISISIKRAYKKESLIIEDAVSEE